MSSGREPLAASSSCVIQHLIGQVRVAYMYVVSPASPIYHLAQGKSLSLCGYVWILTKPEQRRRRDDWNVVAEKPTRQFTALCSTCERKEKGVPEPERPSLGLLHRASLREIVP